MFLGVGAPAEPTGTAPVYAARFDYTSDYLPVAAHAADIPFAFGTLPGESGPEDREMMSHLMMRPR